MFSLDLWNCYARAKGNNQLTTNNAEQFHRKFQQYLVQGTHPTVPAFLESLMAQQALTNKDIAKLELGQSKQESPETRVRTQRIQTLLA
eukprot:8746720-Karenia_brevis.AAC.1